MSENKKIVKVSVKTHEKRPLQSNSSADLSEQEKNSVTPNPSDHTITNSSTNPKSNNTFNYKLLSILLCFALIGTIFALIYSNNLKKTSDDPVELETTKAVVSENLQSDPSDVTDPEDTQLNTFSFYNLGDYSNDDGDCILLHPEDVDLDNGYVYFERSLGDNPFSGNNTGTSIANGFIKKFRDFNPLDWSYKVTRGPYSYRTTNEMGLAYAAYDSFVITATEYLGKKCQYITVEDSDRQYNKETHYVTAKFINWESGTPIEKEGEILIQYSVF